MPEWAVNMGMYATVADTLELTAKRYPDRDALIYPRRDQRFSFAELDERATELANALSDLGVEKGDRVSTMLYNGSEIILTVYACGKLGAVFNPLNYRLPAVSDSYRSTFDSASLQMNETSPAGSR